MTVASPVYSARILGAPDIPVSIREDSGSISLDSSSAPHVEGSVTLAVEDAAFLEDLDPRDNRRMVIDVHPDSHLEPVYSDWVEQARNEFKDPKPTNATGWVTSDGAPVSTTSGHVVATHTSASVAWQSLYAADALHTVPVQTGQPFYVQAEARASRVGTMLVYAMYFLNAAGNFVAFSALQDSGVVNDWTLLETSGIVPASSTADPIVSMTLIMQTTVMEAQVGDTLEVRNLSTTSPYFDGDTNPTGTLERTRWEGFFNPNRSASIMETRTQTGWAQVPDGSPRSFDLGIREANPNRSGATVDVQLASDEALLGDFAQLVDDKTPRTYETSLRGVCNYVLGKIGASLEPGTNDADVTAYWGMTNLVPNPSGEVTRAYWRVGTGASDIQIIQMAAPVAPSGTRAIRFTAAAGDANLIAGETTTDYTVRPGKWYVFSFYIVSNPARNAQAVIQWWSSNGSVLSSQSFGAAGPTVGNEFRRFHVIAQAPAGASHGYPYVKTTGNTAGGLHFVDCAMFYEGDELVDYWDGSTPDGEHYSYEWSAEIDRSTSSREAIIDRPPASLVWKAGTSGLSFLAPLVQAAGFRLVCNERREWTLRPAEYREPGSQTYRYGINVISADEQLSRSADEWFDGAVYRYKWTDDDGIEQTRDDTFALNGSPSKVILREIEAAYPGPGRAEYAVQRAQGKGRTVTATKQAAWTEAAEQPFTATLDGTPIQTGIAEKVAFDIADNTVTTTSRTTDTPAGAIDLLPGSINALTGTINDL